MPSKTHLGIFRCLDVELIPNTRGADAPVSRAGTPKSRMDVPAEGEVRPWDWSDS